jgi:hypothetical protein
MSDREIEKLELEIRQLKQDTGAMGRLRGMLPVVTSLVAIGGLWFGVAQFVSESKLNRQLRWEDQVRSHIEELLAFPRNEQYTVSRASFLLQDLRNLQAHLDLDEDNVTDTLINLVQDDCDFDNRRHVGLEMALLDHWPPYVEALVDDPGLQDFIIYKYFQAFRHLHEQKPPYFESLRYVPGSGYIVGEGGYTDEELYLRFQTLVRGFSQHLGLMESGSERWSASIASFQEAVNNSSLTETLFGAIIPDEQDAR